MALEGPSTFWDCPWQPDGAGARDTQALFYARVQKRQSIEVLDCGPRVKLRHHSSDFVLEFPIYLRLLQKVMQVDRQR